MDLFKRDGTKFSGRVETDERGLAFYRYIGHCSRCGGAGGSDKWGPAGSNTGWKCYDCGGSGKGPERTERLYTAERLEKINAIATKKAAKRAAAAAAAEEARRAPYLEWRKTYAHVLSQIGALATEDLRTRIANDADRFVIPPAWLLDVAIASILRHGIIADVREASAYVGEVGKRLEVTLECERLIDLSDGDAWPRRYFYIALMRDEAGNRVVYKGGNPPLGVGEKGRFRVTVKDHENRDGERQTIVQRPVSLETA